MLSQATTSERIYRDILTTRVQSALEMAQAVRKISHPGILGEIREILVRELFRPLLPPNIGVGTGKLVDYKDTLSRQTDIILFDRSLAPPMMLNEHLGIFPIDSCLCVIEVKSTLTLAQLKQSHGHALTIGGLSYSRKNVKSYSARCLLFAFSQINVCRDIARSRHPIWMEDFIFPSSPFQNLA